MLESLSGWTIRPQSLGTLLRKLVSFKNSKYFFIQLVYECKEKNQIVESKYCSKHRNLRSQSSLGENSNHNNIHVADLENGTEYYHPGYGLMPPQVNVS